MDPFDLVEDVVDWLDEYFWRNQLGIICLAVLLFFLIWALREEIL